MSQKQVAIAKARRTKKVRAHIRSLEMPRLCVFRSNQHLYVQLIAADGASTLAQASTLDKEYKALKLKSVNVASAAAVGKLVAERALKQKITRVAFDRSGYQYHGRVKAIAEAARAAGLEF